MSMTKVSRAEWEFETPHGYENVLIEIVVKPDCLEIGHNSISWADLDEARGVCHGWQPIETAPKDGTWVLLLGGSTSFDSDCFGSPPCVVGKWLTADEGYILSDDNGRQFAWYASGVYGIYEAPTHWMPLPANTGLRRTGPTDDQNRDSLSPVSP